VCPNMSWTILAVSSDIGTLTGVMTSILWRENVLRVRQKEGKWDLNEDG